MFTPIQGREERRRYKRRIIEVVIAAGGGVDAAVPAGVLAARLGWSDQHAEVVMTLVREIMVDGEDPEMLGFNNGGVFHAVTRADRQAAAAIARDRARQYRRIAERLEGPRH